MVKKYLFNYISIFFLATLVSCNSNQDQASEASEEESLETWVSLDNNTKPKTVLIEGKVRYPDKGFIKFDFVGNQIIETVDTLELDKDYSFSTQVRVTESTMFRFHFYGKQYVPLVVSPADDKITVIADGNDSRGDYSAIGSKETEHLHRVNKMAMRYQEKFSEINKAFQGAQASGNQVQAIEIRDEAIQKKQEYLDSIKYEIESAGNSIVALIALNYLSGMNDFDYIKSIVDKFEKELPNSMYTKQMIGQIKKAEGAGPVVGDMAPEINLSSPDGDFVKLSSLKGKYVLLDFWASWCKPCRMENPNVVKMYQKYNGNGFEIYSVSLDRRKKDWVKAIKDDGLDWVHVSDLKYFNSSAADLYEVNAIPATFLIDTEGKIIGKNLRGPSLEAKLKEIFG